MLAVLRQLTIRGCYHREVRYMHDGGCVALDWWLEGSVQGPPDAMFTGPTLLVLHGLSGKPFKDALQHEYDSDCFESPSCGSEVCTNGGM